MAPTEEAVPGVPPRREVVARAVWLVLLSVLLTLGFASNRWGVASQAWFESHQRDTEAHVVGRIVQARHGGLFSYGGLTGIGVERPVPRGRRTWPTRRGQEAQYRAFLAETGFPYFAPYLSQVGFQAIAFSALDRALPFSPAAKLDAFHLLTSLATALCLAAATLWFRLEFGWLPSLAVGATLVASPWLTVFGRNLWWSLWAFYLPMVALLFTLRARPPTRLRLATLGGVVGSTFFVKCLANGYEYVTTAAVMLTVPFFYYSVLDWPGARRWLAQAATLIAATAAAVLASVLVLCAQIGSVRGGFDDGVAHLRFAFENRTSGDARSSIEFYRLGWPEQARRVLATYTGGSVFELDGFPAVPALRPLVGVRYGHLALAFAAASLLVLAGAFPPGRRERSRKAVALVATTWFASLAPLSWFVLFRAHSYVHTNMNYITWHMPFTLFGFALCGLLLADLARILATAVRPGALPAD